MSKEYIVQHKHCKTIRVIRGKDIYSAMRKAHLSPIVWQEATIN